MSTYPTKHSCGREDLLLLEGKSSRFNPRGGSRRLRRVLVSPSFLLPSFLPSFLSLLLPSSPSFLPLPHAQQASKERSHITRYLFKQVTRIHNSESLALLMYEVSTIPSIRSCTHFTQHDMITYTPTTTILVQSYVKTQKRGSASLSSYTTNNHALLFTCAYIISRLSNLIPRAQPSGSFL